MEKFRLGLLTSAWDEAAWELVREVWRNVQNGLIPDSEIVSILVTRHLGETHFGDSMIDNIQVAGLPLVLFSSLRFKPRLRKAGKFFKVPFLVEWWRHMHDQEVMKRLPPTDLIVLLGYMWWFSKKMCQKRTAINLHLALPDGPKGTYRDVIWKLIRTEAKETGIMMHLVTPKLDRGPVITFCRFPIRGGTFNFYWKRMEGIGEEALRVIAEKEGEGNSLFRLIRQKGVTRELLMIVWTIKILAEGRVRIEGGRVLDDKGQVLKGGYDLTAEIEATVKSQGKKEA